MFDLSLYYFNGYVRRETEAVPAGHSARLRGGVRNTFLGSSNIRPTLLMTSERLLYAGHVRYTWLMAICGPSMECVWRIDQGLPYRMYIDSNCHDSRI
jgi:hypothetical protein